MVRHTFLHVASSLDPRSASIAGVQNVHCGADSMNLLIPEVLDALCVGNDRGGYPLSLRCASVIFRSKTQA